MGKGTEEGTEGKELAEAGERVTGRVEPGDVGRPRWQVEEAAKDEAVLRWVERFRFVTGELVAARFGVSWQRANARLRRLERMGLVAGEQQHVGEARAVFITGRGATVLGVARRRAPRPAVQREHELAIVALVAALEGNRSDVQVLTERQCRRRERAGRGEYSIEGNGGGRHERRHWPDAAIELPWGARVAIEVELSAKAPERLRRLVEAHVTASPYTSVHYLVREPALARRLRAIADQTTEQLAWRNTETTQLVVEPLPGASPEIAERIHVTAREQGVADAECRTGTSATSW